MTYTQKITIIAPFAFGYTNHIVKTLALKNDVTATIVYLDKPAFAYKNTWHRVKNVFAKLLFNKNLKKTYVYNRVVAEVKQVGLQDQICVIRPDMLDDATLHFLKRNTHTFIAYYWDSTRRFPRMAEVKDFFDVVYSYDREDVKKYGFQFLTNYIFNVSETLQNKQLFFNISTCDDRLPILEKITAYIKDKNWSHKIVVYHPDRIPVTQATLINTSLSIAEVAEHIKSSKILVEVQREDQIGLSFRIFEALGAQKKLVTTNADVVHYDFYDPNNILVLDPNKITIPQSFVESDYQPVAPAILEKYTIENWIQHVFKLK